MRTMILTDATSRWKRQHPMKIFLSLKEEWSDMPFSLTWLPQVLKDKGLKVARTPGWQDRGNGDVGNIVGVICHHTATPGKNANMPTLNTLIKGRAASPGVAALPGPLA